MADIENDLSLGQRLERLETMTMLLSLKRALQDNYQRVLTSLFRRNCMCMPRMESRVLCQEAVSLSKLQLSRIAIWKGERVHVSEDRIVTC